MDRLKSSNGDRISTPIFAKFSITHKAHGIADEASQIDSISGLKIREEFARRGNQSELRTSRKRSRQRLDNPGTGKGSLRGERCRFRRDAARSCCDGSGPRIRLRDGQRCW